MLIDTGEYNNDSYLEHLSTVLAEEKAKISKIIFTHWHHDHTGGIFGVLNSKYIVTDPEILRFEGAKSVKVPEGIQCKLVKNGDLISVDGAKLR